MRWVRVWSGVALLAACGCAARAQTAQRRIIRGYDDKQHTDLFPFAVLLEKKVPYFKHNKRVCSGSLISSEWVITAAHCLENSIYNIRWGNVTVPREDSTTHSQVIAQYPHPDYFKVEFIFAIEKLYDNSKYSSSRNDIGLLFVQKVPLKSFAKLSAVDYQSMVGHKIVIAGFGGVSFQMKEYAYNKPLQVAEGMINKCSDTNMDSYPVICLSSKCGKQQSAWSGDSGGPLLHDGKLAGVASRAAPPAMGLYTAVSPYLQWVRHTMQAARRAAL